MESPPEWNEIRPPYALIYILSIITWIIVTLFPKIPLDPLLKLIPLAIASILSTYYMYLSRQSNTQLQQSSVVFFLLVWLALQVFRVSTRTITIEDFSFTIKQAQFAMILPMAVIWLVPHSSDTFFGLYEPSEDDRIKSIWKISVLIILVMNIFPTLPRWLEILVIIPLIYEHVKLYRYSKESLPKLTLHIQRELTAKFAVPLSMLKGVFVIMVGFLFEMLSSRLWLLVILIYFGAGFIWFIDFMIPEGMREGNEENFSQFFTNIGQSTKSSDETTEQDEQTATRRRAPVKRHEEPEDFIEIEDSEVEIVTQNEEKMVVEAGSREVSEVGKKAHELGKRVRTELKKPQYNLNHILSTLSSEDFTTAFRVHKQGMEFDSIEGAWSPPKDLILFPIELEEYDYRRVDEILLLGFNRPIDQQGPNAITFNWGSESKYNGKISGDQIQIGDTTFRMKTLVLTREQWSAAKKELEYIDDVTDISYTGFETLHDLQEKLVSISDKWIELRKKAEDAVVNFLAGLLGSKEPIFLGTKDIETQLTEATNENLPESRLDNNQSTEDK